MKFYSLQLYRFIAAILVMFHHLCITRSGNNGVYIFFVISGFVIYLKLFSPERANPFRFFTNRFSKVFFLYWLALVVMYFVNPFPLNVSAISTILLIPGHISRLLVSWSLSFELYFYLLTGMIAYLLPKRFALGCLCAILIISTITTVMYWTGLIQIRGSLLNFCLGKNTWSFFLGLLSGFLSIEIFSFSKIHIAFPASILAYVLLSAAFIFPSDKIASILITGFASMLLIGLSVVYERRNALPPKATAIFGILGDASYAIYLFGPIVGTLIPGQRPLGKFAIVLVTIVTSIFISLTIERRGLSVFRKMILRLNRGATR